ARYEEFLKRDFPRVPVPANDSAFRTLVDRGKELRGLHLMAVPASHELISTYPIVGSDTVAAPRFADERVWINAEQYFGEVPDVAWELFVGGYQPAQKWLKDRNGRKLSSADIVHYQKIITVLAMTDEIMRKIDA